MNKNVQLLVPLNLILLFYHFSFKKTFVLVYYYHVNMTGLTYVQINELYIYLSTFLKSYLSLKFHP